MKTFNVFGEYLESAPHVIFIGKKENLSQAITNGGNVIGLDATFNVTCYKSYSLFALMGRCNAGAYPLGYFVSSAKSELAVREGLLLFKEAATEVLRNNDLLKLSKEFSPSAICIDTDEAENNAVRAVFPNAIVILCHYHFMTSMVNEVRANRHDLPDESIKELMNIIRKLTSSKTAESFKFCLTEMKTVSESFFEYFKVNYLNEKWISTFSEVNRVHLPLSVQRLCRSNMLTEVSFRTLKYVVFDGFVNKRLDYLLYSICFKLYPYFAMRTLVSEKKAAPPRFQVSIDAKILGSKIHK